MINFPSSPTIGQEHTEGGKTWAWDGARWVPVAKQHREQLTAPRTYYVRMDGSDSNSGLSNTAAGAFATIQRAVDAFAPLDLNGQTATIQVGDGTWTAPVSVAQTINGALVITGNATTPDNVLISLTGGSCISASGSTTRVFVEHAKLQTTGISALVAQRGATITGSNLTFGACGYAHVAATSQGQLIVWGACRIVGGAPSFANLDNGFLDATLANFTLTGTPAFTNFIFAYAMSYARIVLATFSGAATGKRYQVESNSYINVNAAGENYLPGNAAGTKASGGQYL